MGEKQTLKYKHTEYHASDYLRKYSVWNYMNVHVKDKFMKEHIY